MLATLLPAFGVACLIGLSCAATPRNPAVDGIHLADSLAAANAKTEHGKRYADSASAAGMGPLAAALKACRDSVVGQSSTPKPGARDTSSVDVYLMLSRRGSVKTLLVSPPRPGDDCLARKAAVGLALPSPPGPNYWIRVRVRIPPPG